MCVHIHANPLVFLHFCVCICVLAHVSGGFIVPKDAEALCRTKEAYHPEESVSPGVPVQSQ